MTSRLKSVRARLRVRYPTVFRTYMYGKRAVFLVRYPTRRMKFDAISRRNVWQNRESRSGFGSTEQATELLRENFPEMIRLLEVENILDIPCGDFHWMQLLNLQIPYIGADISEALVKKLQQEHASGNKREFRRLDIVNDSLPSADLTFVRECFNHFSFRRIHAATANVKLAGGRYLAVTHYPAHTLNTNQETGFTYRPINFTIAPFGWPPPIHTMSESACDGRVVAVWRLDEIKL
jgi:hypothetical protein